MTRRIFKLGNVAKRAVASPAGFRGLRNVAMIACLAGMTMFLGCDKDKDKGDYTIKYSPGTHSSGEDYSQAKTKGESVTLRGKTYTRAGFTQTGWSKKKEGTSKDYNLLQEYEDDADVNLFPFWVEGDIDDDKKYHLPTNVKFIKENEGYGTLSTQTCIKIGNNYHYINVISGLGSEEYYIKYNNNGTWTQYQNFTYGGWEDIGKFIDDRWVDTYFLGFMSEEAWYVDMKNAVKGGKETIAGVSTDIYTLASSGVVLYHDPVTGLFFKITTSKFRYEVTSWDKTVTSFGITGLP